MSPWTSRTLDARRGAPSTNSLARLDAPLACASSRQSPSSHNSGGTGHTMAARRESTRTGMRVSTRTWRRESARLVNMNLSHLWKVPRPQGNSIFDLFRPKELSAAVMCLGPVVVAFQKPEERTGSCVPKTGRTIGGLKELTPYISAVFPFKIPKRLIHAHVKPIIAPTAGGLSSQVVDRRPGHCMADLYNIWPAKVFLAAHESFLNSKKCCKSSTSTE